MGLGWCIVWNFDVLYRVLGVELILMRWFLFLLFIIGIILAILGWFFDRVSYFPWLMRKISPDYVNSINALDTLAANKKHALTPFHPGFNALLERWPNLSKKLSVVLIGRSVAYMAFGEQVKGDFELIAFDKDNAEIKPRWKESAARSLFVDEEDKKIFWIGTVVFFNGLGIAFVSRLIDFFTMKPKTMNNSEKEPS